MSRYRIYFDDGSSTTADDARIENGLVRYIKRDSHEEVAIPSQNVVEVSKENPGPFEGGKRFTGEHSGSFSATPGSIGASNIESIMKDGYIKLNNGKEIFAKHIKSYNGFVEFYDYNREEWRAINNNNVSNIKKY